MVLRHRLGSSVRATPVEVTAITLLPAEGAPPKKSGLVIALEPNRIWLDGVVVSDAGPINSPDGIARLRSNTRLEQFVTEQWPIYVAATGDANWNQLTEVLVGAGVRSANLGLLFHRQRVAPTLAVSALTPQLQGKKGIGEMAPAIAEAFAPCAPLTEAVQYIAQAGSPDALPELLGEPVANAIAACECSVGTDVARSAYWSMLFGDRPTYSVASVALMLPAVEPDPTTALLAYPDSAIWADVAPKIREVAGKGTRRIAFARVRSKAAPPMPRKRRKQPPPPSTTNRAP